MPDAKHYAEEYVRLKYPSLYPPGVPVPEHSINKAYIDVGIFTKAAVDKAVKEADDYHTGVAIYNGSTSG
jgi:hypothetical protein